MWYKKWIQFEQKKYLIQEFSCGVNLQKVCLTFSNQQEKQNKGNWFEV
jgi:hypothetical protein